MKKITRILGILSIASAVAFNAAAQDNKMDKDNMKTEKSVRKTDKVLADIIGANEYEVWLLELVGNKARNEELKSVAAEILPQHRQMGEELKQWAMDNGYKTEAKKEGKYQQKINKWNSHQQGLELDYDLAEELVDIHKDDIDLLQNAKEDTKDAGLKAWIDKQIPVMRGHLVKLEPLKDKTKKPWKAENRPSPDMRESVK